MKQFLLKANAKINIGLEVLGKRPDDFHNINSAFVCTCLSDDLLFEENEKLIVECEPTLDIPSEKNIVYKAANVLQNFYNKKDFGAKITIHKRIPIGSGLGGGSSNAATALFGLAKLWDIEFNFGDLESLALPLGSDVPFFVNEGASIVSGRGEFLDYFDYKIPYWVLLVYPDINISTKWAYESLNIDFSKKTTTDLKSIILESVSRPELLKENVKNDFEPLLFQEYPEIGKIKNKLYDSGAVFAQLSGSGSTVFGFFTDKDHCEKAGEMLADFSCFICPPEL